MDEPRPGIYEELVTDRLEALLTGIAPERLKHRALDPGDAHEALTRHLTGLARRALRAAGGTDAGAVTRQIDLANRIAAAIEREAPGDESLTISTTGELHEILPVARPPATPAPLPRPAVPLSQSALLVNGRSQPRIGHEIPRELASADRVDLLCAFVKWHGLRVIEEHIAAFLRRPGARMRVITTTYMGATEQRALDRLAELGAEVRISYETHSTRLHAKAWLFERDTGFSTGYVGSSNLSRAALLDGLEWNVRLSARESGHLLDTFAATFDDYWDDAHFAPYDPDDADHRARLRDALAREGAGNRPEQPFELAALDVRPYPFQAEILEQLDAERTVHHRPRSLVVMATGTGKTVVAGLDYRRLRQAGSVDSLLFIAHRREIIDQSRATFRQVLRDGRFGERMVDGDRPKEWRHVFASVQSLATMDLERDLPPDRFDMVIVDEFHHASPATATYARLLSHLRPRVLVGLTATPERADGGDILGWFGGRIAVEMRLWEALEQGLLAPFQYFGIDDETDLASIRWVRGAGYDTGELTNLYTANDMRMRIVLRALADKVADVRSMRAAGFCVSIAHAEYMARRFTDAGIPAAALTSRTPSDERRRLLAELRDRRLNALFTVDLLNEGVDIPQIDTVLFLRPTESATVFLQQLGRGLRHADDKPCLTVLDFIGHQHADFRFDLRFRALTGVSRRGIQREVDQGFPSLPAGCHIALEGVAADRVLANVRGALRLNWRDLVAELRALGDVDLPTFLYECDLELDGLFRGTRTWAALRRAAGFDRRPPGDHDAVLGRAIARMLYIDDPERLDLMRAVLSSPAPPIGPAGDERLRRRLAMLHFRIWGNHEPVGDVAAGFTRLWAEPARRKELLALVDPLHERIHRVTTPLDGDVPLHVHARYSRDEALAAFGMPNPGSVREGVKWLPDERADVLFVTLDKTEAHYSPTTMYEDRAITPEVFQWESQNATSEASPTGRRYVNHRREGSAVHLFVRESKQQEGSSGAPPYLYAGTAQYVSHTGERPMRIIWRLDHALPADVFRIARVAA